MYWRAIKILAAAVSLAALSAGCGGGSPQSSGTAPIAFRSRAVDANGVIRPNFSCGGGALWLPLEWGAVPSNTKELAIYIGRFRYEKRGDAKRLIVPFGELVALIQPSQQHNPPSNLPQGASWSFFGLSCPQQRTGQKILQEIFALDRVPPSYRKLTKPLATRLTEEALKGRPREDARSPGPLTKDAVGIGRFVATYGP
jgi:hypothetical protein